MNGKIKNKMKDCFCCSFFSWQFIFKLDSRNFMLTHFFFFMVSVLEVQFIFTITLNAKTFLFSQKKCFLLFCFKTFYNQKFKSLEFSFSDRLEIQITQCLKCCPLKYYFQFLPQKTGLKIFVFQFSRYLIIYDDDEGLPS